MKGSGQREQCVQRPWGRSLHGVLTISEEVWLEVNEGGEDEEMKSEK